jgi:hypothetical protein
LRPTYHEATAARFQSAYNSGNPASIAALFAKGGVYLTPAGTLLTDPQAMEKAIDGRIKAGWTKETVKATAAHTAGDQVWGYEPRRVCRRLIGLSHATMASPSACA